MSATTDIFSQKYTHMQQELGAKKKKKKNWLRDRGEATTG
jgi:hypothetical protein